MFKARGRLLGMIAAAALAVSALVPASAGSYVDVSYGSCDAWGVTNIYSTYTIGATGPSSENCWKKVTLYYWTYDFGYLYYGSAEGSGQPSYSFPWAGMGYSQHWTVCGSGCGYNQSYT